MVKVELVYTRICPFCQPAKELFRSLKKDYKFEYEEIDAATSKGQRLVEKYSIMSVPTIIIDSRLIFTGVPSKEKVIEAIKGEKWFMI